MRVLFLEQQPCMRALKLAVGLRSLLPELELSFAYQGKTLSAWYGSGDELFDRWFALGDEPRARLTAFLAEYRPDLVHSHNLPDTLTVLANELADGTPVVHDVHDLQSLRRTPYENGFPQPRAVHELERAAVEESAALVTVSDELLARLARRYRLPARTLVFPNYALARHLPAALPLRPPPDPARPRIVYEGTLSTNGGHYDLREIFRALVEAGATLDVYPNRPVREYHELAARLPGLTVHDALEPAALLRVLPGYDFGWAGFDEALNKAHIDTALPNKLFEYLACGLPVLTLEHEAMRRFLEERQVGIVLRRAQDLRAELARRDLTALRERAAATRHEVTVEANIASLVDLYAALVHEGPAGAADGRRLESAR